MCLRRLSTYIIAKGGQSEQRWTTKGMDLGGTLKKWSLEEDMMGDIILALFPSAPCNGIALRGCARLCPVSLLKHPLTSLQGCEPKVVTRRFDKDLPVCSYWAGFSAVTSIENSHYRLTTSPLEDIAFLNINILLMFHLPRFPFSGEIFIKLDKDMSIHV